MCAGKIPQGKDVRYCAWQFSMQNKGGGEDRGVIGLFEVALDVSMSGSSLPRNCGVSAKMK